jgi:hypothetical protein
MLLLHDGDARLAMREGVDCPWLRRGTYAGLQNDSI